MFIRLALLRASIIWWAIRLPCQPRSWSGGEREGKIPSADVSRAANKMQANTCLWGRHRLFRVSHSLLLAAELRSSLITVELAATSSSAPVSWTVRRRRRVTTRNHLICDEFWRNFCNIFRDRHRFANGPFGLQFRPSFYDEPLITVMDWKLKSSQNKLPLFACDGRKKF